MNAMSEEYGGAFFYKVIGDSSADASSLMKREGVRAVPSFHFWKNGEKVDVVNGANFEAVTANVVPGFFFLCQIGADSVIFLGPLTISARGLEICTQKSLASTCATSI